VRNIELSLYLAKEEARLCVDTVCVLVTVVSTVGAEIVAVATIEGLSQITFVAGTVEAALKHRNAALYFINCFLYILQ